MKGKGFTGIMAGSLSISFEDKDWGVFIRHKDDKSYGPFYKYHLKEVTSEGIKKFLPNWKKLNWEKILETAISPREYFAEDEEFKVNLIKKENATISDEEMIQEFIELLKQ